MQNDKPMWKSVVLAAVAVVVAIGVAGIYLKKRPSRAPSQAAVSEAAVVDSRAEAEAAELREANMPQLGAPPMPAIPTSPPPVRTVSVPVPEVERLQASPAARELVERLRQLRQGGPLTPEQAAAWRETLQQLVQQGPAGAAAIRDFLAQNQDMNFSGAESGLLGHSSLRRAMFSALEQIGGPEAANVALEILQQTAAPSEIALLAQFLDKQAPGEYRQQMLAAARDALAMASAGKLQGWDVGPLFQVFQRYGDANAVAELAGYLPQWKFYATLALAGMPSGEGIPALTRMATDPGGAGNRAFAWEMLAQLSTQYAGASAALLDGARTGTIPAAAWPMIASALGGNYQQIRTEEFDRIPVSERGPGIKTYHIASGNQNFYSAPQAGYWPQDYLQQRLALINQLTAMATTPQATQALQEQQRILTALLQR